MALSGHNLSKNWADPQSSDAFRRRDTKSMAEFPSFIPRIKSTAIYVEEK
jgi:hypothetical protein